VIIRRGLRSDCSGKILTTYIFPEADEEEEDDDDDERPPNLQIQQPIVDWIAASLDSDDQRTQAIALDALGDVTARSALCAEDLAGRALPVAARLVDAGAYETFELLSNFTTSYVGGFKEKLEGDAAAMAAVEAIVRAWSAPSGTRPSAGSSSASTSRPLARRSSRRASRRRRRRR
jgi:hypothetical protein